MATQVIELTKIIAMTSSLVVAGRKHRQRRGFCTFGLSSGSAERHRPVTSRGYRLFRRCEFALNLSGTLRCRRCWV